MDEDPGGALPFETQVRSKPFYWGCSDTGIAKGSVIVRTIQTSFLLLQQQVEIRSHLEILNSCCKAQVCVSAPRLGPSSSVLFAYLRSFEQVQDLWPPHQVFYVKHCVKIIRKCIVTKTFESYCKLNEDLLKKPYWILIISHYFLIISFVKQHPSWASTEPHCVL